MLLYAEKRGRFIPCRGGGTDTTYYTDAHDVDEDRVTIAGQGGDWLTGSWTGITYRNTDNYNTGAWDNVASYV